MAITNGFKPSRKPTDLELRRVVVANAVGSSALTIGIGSALQPGATGHNRFATVCGTSNPVLGVVVGLEFQGKITELTSILGINAAKSTSSATAGVYSDNETSGDWTVVYIPTAIPITYTATLSAAAGTTTDSAGFGYFNLGSTAGGGTLDETSITLFGGTAGQFWSNGALTTTSTSVTGHFYKTL